MTDPAWLPRKLSRCSERWRFGLAVLAGAMTALVHLPLSPTLYGLALIWGTFGGLTLFYLLSATANPGWAAFRMGWASGTAYFAIALHWIIEPFLVDIARHGWMAPFALVFLSGGLALFWGAAVWLARRIADHSFAFALAWAASLALAEFTRGHVLTGFPWALLGYVWIEAPALAAAAVIGPYGLTLATALLAALFGLAMQLGAPRSIPGLMAFLGAGVIYLSLGPIGSRPWHVLEDPQVTVRLVQPNAPQHEKWDPAKVNTFFQRQLKSTAAAAETRPDIILWPETAIPWNLSQADDAIAIMADAAAGTPLVFGANRSNGDLSHNSLAVIGADGTLTHIYDKHHLVPFGEYIPLGAIAKFVGLRSFAARDGYGFSPGPGPQTLDLGALGKALPLICYEAIFPANLLNAPERPDWILQITNDAWFGDIAGPQQHLVQARFRAVEQGLPLVRAANTGISAVIDANGRVMASLPLGEEGFLDAPLPPPMPPTLYARTGNSPTILAMLFLFGAALMLQRRNSH